MSPPPPPRQASPLFHPGTDRMESNCSCCERWEGVAVVATEFTRDRLAGSRDPRANTRRGAGTLQASPNSRTSLREYFF